MAKLHELIPVRDQLKMQAEKVRADLRGTFDKKAHHFTEKTVTYQSNDEGVAAVVESQLDLQTTVPAELKWISKFLTENIDVAYQVAEGNMVARADVIVNDAAVLSNIPATTLLELDKRMRELRDLVSAIPTLDPAKGFRPDADKGAGIFRARDDVRARTKKINKPLVLDKGNDKHAAQVQLVTEDVVVGSITTLEWSGLITTAAKGEMLERVEVLTAAIRQARARANEMEVNTAATTKIGAVIVNYVFSA